MNRVTIESTPVSRTPQQHKSIARWEAFIDGSENPTLLDAPIAALLPEGVPGAAGTVLLLQKWKHKAAEWEALPIDQQECIIGRTKLDSVELENKPDSHVARTDQDEFGKIFRRNMPPEPILLCVFSLQPPI